jgi:hypothetical protein
MTIAEFRASPPDELDGPLLALWWAAEDNWEKAHEIAQDIEGAEGSWVHAYLHRKEGDQSNASYWYRRAGRSAAEGDFEAEWYQIVEELLARR